MFAAKKQVLLMAKSEKRERFEKVASNRVQRIIDTLDLLKNCSNKGNYDYSEEDVELMFKEINRAVKEARAVFSSELSRAEKQGFRFNR